jgi:hypothetical protein
VHAGRLHDVAGRLGAAHGQVQVRGVGRPVTGQHRVHRQRHMGGRAGPVVAGLFGRGQGAVGQLAAGGGVTGHPAGGGVPRQQQRAVRSAVLGVAGAGERGDGGARVGPQVVHRAQAPGQPRLQLVGVGQRGELRQRPVVLTPDQQRLAEQQSQGRILVRQRVDGGGDRRRAAADHPLWTVRTEQAGRLVPPSTMGVGGDGVARAVVGGVPVGGRPEQPRPLARRERPPVAGRLGHDRHQVPLGDDADALQVREGLPRAPVAQHAAQLHVEHAEVGEVAQQLRHRGRHRRQHVPVQVRRHLRGGVAGRALLPGHADQRRPPAGALVHRRGHRRIADTVLAENVGRLIGGQREVGRSVLLDHPVAGQPAEVVQRPPSDEDQAGVLLQQPEQVVLGCRQHVIDDQPPARRLARHGSGAPLSRLVAQPTPDGRGLAVAGRRHDHRAPSRQFQVHAGPPFRWGLLSNPPPLLRAIDDRSCDIIAIAFERTLTWTEPTSRR